MPDRRLTEVDAPTASAGSLLARRDDGLEISLDRGRVDVDVLERWLSVESYWAKGRSREVVERSLVGSMCAGVYEGSAADAPMVAFARVVTDDATFGWLCDVYVDPPARGRGVGSWLVRELVVELMERRGVQRVLLATRDAHAVYASAGFAPLEGAWRWMEIDHRPTRAELPLDPPPGLLDG